MRWLLCCVVFVLASGTPALRAEESARGQELRHLLNKPVHNFKGFDDPKSTLNDVLEFLSNRYDLSFDIDEYAFEQADIKEVGESRIAQPNSFPAMHARLGAILKKILRRVSPSAAYIIRDDVIEITTVQAIRNEFFADRPAGPLPPLVSGTFSKVSLASALKELAWEGNIVLDVRSAKEAETLLVTANFANVPLDTATRMLADMAGLKAVPMGNVLYVTNKANARPLMEEQEKLKLQRQRDRKAQADNPAEKKSNKDKKQQKIGK